MNVHRQMRVFVSSTFRDMHAEREQLIKRTFPRIQKLCEARGVVWGEVDLRWGIPDEQAAEGNVLPACLEEIERCRPFFIGLLGERYGSAASLSGELLERWRWLAGYRERSVTELEILHGVLNDPAAAEHALFYFRDPAYLDRLPVGFDPADFRSEEPAAAKLHDLKERIRESDVSVREPYRDAEELGAWVEADLSALLDRLFPLDAGYDPVAAAHIQFAAQRRRHWVGREAELRHLDEMLTAGPAALVTGPPGVGLSALLANWAAARRRSHPGTLVLEHYVGAHPGATSLDGCCRQLCLGLAAARNLPPPSVAVERDWPDLFVEQLALAGAERPVLLVIDGADGLRGRGESAGADWLPSELPPGVRLVASAGEEAVLAVERRGWPLLRVAELGSDERAELVRSYLAVFGKELSAERIRQIATVPATGKPFHLALLLEELRRHDEHATLGDRLAELLAAPDVLHLCGEVFRRCERDYDGAAPDFTAGALGLLAVARSGLSDTELCELLGGPGGRLPQRPWSELQLALQAVLVSRDGLIGFAQSEPARVAWQRYVGTPVRQLALQRRLADYFLARPDTPRAAVELPFHLRQLAAWDELATWMSRADAFRIAWHLAPEEVCASWKTVEELSPRRAAEACKAFPADLRPAAMNLLRQLGHWADALVLARQAVQSAQAEGDSARWLETLLTVGEIEIAAGSPYAAEEMFAQAEEQAAAAQNPRALLRALHGRAHALDGLLARHRNTALHTELSRHQRAVADRALRIFKDTPDAQLQSEALVLWLEGFVAQSGTRETLETVGTAFGSFLGTLMPGFQQRIEKGLANFQRTFDGRLQQLEAEAVARLRHTRHRALALRADIALAKAEGDRARLLAALEALRQHGAARDDLNLLAGAYDNLAAQEQGADKLVWLERQAELFTRSGRRTDLVRNEWAQARLLWPELGRRDEASALIRRAARERRALPSRRERRRFLTYRWRLWLGLDEKKLQRLLSLSAWVVGPLWLWSVWRFCLWTATWFGRLPFFGLVAYFLAIVFATPGFLFVLMGLSDLRKAVRRVFPKRKPRPVARMGDGMWFLKVFGVPVRALTHMKRGTLRTRRIAKHLGLHRLPARLTWLALAVPTGSVLTLCYWQASGWSRTLLLPLGLVGQMLIVGAVLGLLSPALARRAGRRRTSRLAPVRGSGIGFFCLLAMIRFKRRLLGHRRHLPHRVTADRLAPAAPEPGGWDELGKELAKQAFALAERGDTDGALSAFEELTTRLRASPHPEAKGKLLICLKAQASLCSKEKWWPRVLSFSRDLEVVCRELGKGAEVRLALGLQSHALSESGDVEGALVLHRQEESRCRERPDILGLLSAIIGQARLYEERLENRAEALALHRRAETICRNTGNRERLHYVLSDEARLLKAQGDFAAALAVHQRNEALCRELGDDEGLAWSFNHQGLVYRKLGREAQALQLFREAERIHDRIDNHRGLLAALSNQALIFKAHGDLAEAGELYRRKEALCLEWGDDQGLREARKSLELIQRAAWASVR